VLGGDLDGHAALDFPRPFWVISRPLPTKKEQGEDHEEKKTKNDGDTKVAYGSSQVCEEHGHATITTKGEGVCVTVSTYP
jgi:hypothetical protein